MHDGHKNHYSFVMNNQNFVLTPLKPLQPYEGGYGGEKEKRARKWERTT